jgi:tetratricopeptide (TPR) repeat protein
VGQQLDRAQSVLEGAVRRNPENADAWLFLGMMHLRAGRHQDAITALEQSVLLQDRAQARYYLGFCLEASGRPDQALPHFERAAALKPEEANAWVNVARVRAALGRFEKAAQALQQARRLKPVDRELDALAYRIAQGLITLRAPEEAVARHERGVELAGEGRNEEAMREFEAALARAPTFADCHHNLGLLARRREDFARAEREYRAAIAGYAAGEEPLRAEAQNNLANLLVARGGSPEEALTLVREALTVRGERAGYLDTLARACDAKGDRACAVEAFRKLLASGEPLAPEVKGHAQARLGALSP